MKNIVVLRDNEGNNVYINTKYIMAYKYNRGHNETLVWMLTRPDHGASYPADQTKQITQAMEDD